MKSPPTWLRWSEVFGVVLHRPHLRKTIPTALIVGTVLFLVNHGDVVLRGEYSYRVLIKALVTYCIPFVVSNIGVLIATRRPSSAALASEPPEGPATSSG